MGKPKKARSRPRKRLDTSAVKPLNPLTQLAGDRKRGRRTIADNHLLGARNGLLSFFEGVWHEVGWQLLEIRKQGTGTMDDVRKMFEVVRSKPAYRDNPAYHWADCFLRGLPQAAQDKERRANRIRVGALYTEIQRMRNQQQEFQSTSAYAEIAVQQAGENEKELIQSDAKKKKARLEELNENLHRTENEARELDNLTRGQETHFYCSQLLEFLCKGKYAVKPFPLANSLAGLPEMGWRQSLARCSRMPKSWTSVRYPYGILEAVSKIWNRRFKNPHVEITDLFHTEIPKLRKKDEEARSYLSEGWRDLRMAIEQCSKDGHAEGFVPYAITGQFVSNQSRPKNQAERILEEHERLPT